MREARRVIGRHHRKAIGPVDRGESRSHLIGNRRDEIRRWKDARMTGRTRVAVGRGVIRKGTEVFIETRPVEQIVADQTDGLLAGVAERSLAESTVWTVVVILQPRYIRPDDTLVVFADETRFTDVDVVLETE